jgi:hypothetical protein
VRRYTADPKGNDFIILVDDDARLVRHDSLEAAEAEARRLADANPGQKFRTFAAIRDHAPLLPAGFAYTGEYRSPKAGEWVWSGRPALALEAWTRLAAWIVKPCPPDGYEFTGEYRTPYKGDAYLFGSPKAVANIALGDTASYGGIAYYILRRVGEDKVRYFASPGLVWAMDGQHGIFQIVGSHAVAAFTFNPEQMITGACSLAKAREILGDPTWHPCNTKVWKEQDAAMVAKRGRCACGYC